MNQTKHQGTIGELKISQFLMEKGYYIFREVGDNSPVDIIALKDNKYITFQVKCYTSKGGKVTVYLKNSSKSYSRKYDKNDFDYFAVYVIDRNLVLFIKLEEVYLNKYAMEIRIDKSKRNNKSINLYENYLTFE